MRLYVFRNTAVRIQTTTIWGKNENIVFFVSTFKHTEVGVNCIGINTLSKYKQLLTAIL